MRVQQPVVQRGGLKAEELDEGMPQIMVMEDGGYARHESIVAERAPHQGSRREAGVVQGRGNDRSRPETSGLTDAERRELEALREEKAKVSLGISL